MLAETSAQIVTKELIRVASIVFRHGLHDPFRPFATSGLNMHPGHGGFDIPTAFAHEPMSGVGCRWYLQGPTEKEHAMLCSHDLVLQGPTLVLPKIMRLPVSGQNCLPIGLRCFPL